jgi:hypothetical protein
VVGLAVLAGIGALVLTGSRALAVVTSVLRFLVLTLLVAVAGSLSSGEVVAVVALVGGGGLVAEYSFLRRLSRTSLDPSPRSRRSTPPQAWWAWAGGAALGLVGLVAAVAAVLGVGAGQGGPGLLLAVGMMLELGLLGLILRPSLLGQGPVYQTLARPVRQAIQASVGPDGAPLTGRDDGEASDDPAWRRVVVRLLDDEFALESDPAAADPDSVFLPRSPVHRQCERRRDLLLGNDLRVGGPGPRLRSVEVVRGRAPVTLRITVDHQENHLVDRAGQIVGVRPAERRIGTLWLVPGADGRPVIAESIVAPVVAEG